MVMKLVKNLKAVSTLIATILLIAITVSGGIVAYAVFTSAANVGSQKTQVNFDYLALYKSIGEPKAIFAATLKNAGSKPIVSLKIRLHNESDYLSPSVTNSTPLNPGMSTSIVLTPPTIHDQWYVVGNFYTVQIVKAVATDGSSYSHVTTVMCLGLTGAVEAGSVYLTVLANPDLGSTTPPRGVHSYSIGQPATVSALPTAGYEFLWWTLDGEEFIDNPITLLMDANHTLSAFFIVPETPQIYINYFVDYIPVSSTECWYYQEPNGPMPLPVPTSKPESPQITWTSAELNEYTKSAVVRFVPYFVTGEGEDIPIEHVNAELILDGVSQGVKRTTGYSWPCIWGDFSKESHNIKIYYWVDEGVTVTYGVWGLTVCIGTTSADVIKTVWEKEVGTSVITFVWDGYDPILKEWVYAHVDTDHLYADDMQVADFELSWNAAKISFRGTNFLEDIEQIVAYQQLIIR